MVQTIRALSFLGCVMFHLKLDQADLDRAFRDLSDKRAPWAAANALNDTAEDVLKHMQSRMQVVFDRPTRFTQNAFMVMKANPRSMAATVQERPSVGRRHYLKVQEAGGARGQTALESLMASKLPYAGALRSIIPAEYAKLNQFGNWSPGERNQVLSILGAQRDTRSNTTEASKKRAPKRASYFIPKHGLAPGVYRRKSKDDIPQRVLKFSDKVPSYQKRLGFYDGAEEVFAARLPMNLKLSLERELAKLARR